MEALEDRTPKIANLLPLPAEKFLPLRDSTAQLKREDGKRYALVTRGSASVKIYDRGDLSGKGPYTISWCESSSGNRLRAMRSTLRSAVSHAGEVATNLANGELWRRELTHEEFVALKRDRQELREIKSRFTAAGLTWEQALDDHCRRRRNGIAPKQIGELVGDLLASRKSVGYRGRPISQRWARTLKQQLDAFAKHFKCTLDEVTAASLEAWLNSLGVGPRTRTGYRAAVLSLVNYAKFKRAIPEDWRELDRVPFLKPEDAEIKILTPAQLRKLLDVAPSSIKPLICLCAFAGIRHEEIVGKKLQLLQWADIKLKDPLPDAKEPKYYGTITIRRASSKVAKDRKIPISANLAAWLRLWSDSTGLVCRLKNTSNALCRAKKKAGIPSKRDATRNTLRKSFITYRKQIIHNVAQVAEEAGTSVAKIRSNYDAVDVEESEALAWFDIWPSAADCVQQDFGSDFGRSRRRRVIAAS
jgi:integrase